MSTTRHLTVIIEREGSGYVALCPELDIASEGDTVEQARQNLVESVELFFETADSAELSERLGTLRSIIRQSRLPRELFES